VTEGRRIPGSLSKLCDYCIHGVCMDASSLQLLRDVQMRFEETPSR
jgi:hypothetical protein